MTIAKKPIFIPLTTCLIVISSCFNNYENDFSTSNLYPWCIVAYDSLERSPMERITLLNDLGFQKYAYDWRERHLEQTLTELKLAAENDIEVIAVWLWLNAKRDSINTLSSSNKEFLKIIEQSGLKTTFWLSFNNNFFDGLSHEKALKKGIELVNFIALKADSIDCKVALYNHSGWFGNPYNQLEIIERLPQHELKVVYNFHHAHQNVEDFHQLAKDISPYLVAVNLNGMTGEGPKILEIGMGEHEQYMIELLQKNGFHGPWGILGHISDKDVKVILQDNIQGLNAIFE